jgi:hypothetical protein
LRPFSRPCPAPFPPPTCASSQNHGPCFPSNTKAEHRSSITDNAGTQGGTPYVSLLRRVSKRGHDLLIQTLRNKRRGSHANKPPKSICVPQHTYSEDICGWRFAVRLSVRSDALECGKQRVLQSQLWVVQPTNQSRHAGRHKPTARPHSRHNFTVKVPPQRHPGRAGSVWLG